MKNRRIVPLVNFESAAEEFDFGCGVTLAALTQSEADVLGSPHHIGETSHSTRSHTSFKLQLVYEPSEPKQIIRGYGPHEHDLHQQLFNVVVALRLYKAGDFGVPIYIELLSTDGKEWEAGGFWGQAKRHGLTYELKIADLPPILNLTSEIRDARSKADRRLDLALLRFGDTYGRNRSEDALVDSQIALESCLAPDFTTEIGYRLSLRGAALLADQYPTAHTRNLINLAYNARSKLVHRGWNLQDCFNDKDFKKKVEQYEKISGHKLLPQKLR